MKPSEYPDSPFRGMFEMWERRLDEIFDRISGPLNDMPAGSTSVSRENSDETPISYICPSPQDGEGIILPTQEAIIDSLEGEFFLSQSPSPDSRYEAVPQVNGGSLVSRSESTLFACEIPPPRNAQFAIGVCGVSENHRAHVSDDTRTTQCPVSQILTSENSNLPLSSTCSPSNVGREIEVQDDSLVTCMSVQSLALNSDVTAHICQTTLNNASFFVTGPSPGDDRKHPMTVLRPSINRHGTGLGSGLLINTGTDSEALKAEIVALTFPRHGPDQGKTRFVGIIEQDPFCLTFALGLVFPKHDPDITAFFRQLASLQFVVAPNWLPLLPASHAFVVRMAEGKEAYWRLRPVRRPRLC